MGLFSDDSGFDEAKRANELNRNILDQIELPKYTEFNPNLYTNQSAQYQLTSDDPVARSAQLSALAKMSGLADTGLSDADQAEFTQAANQGNQLARSGNAAALNNAQARGVGGSGLEFLMREQANQDGAQRAQDAGMQTAANAAKQRALYNQAFLQGTSNMRDQDYRTNANNTNIINQFNQANTQARNQTNNANTGLQNQAFQYNQGLKDKNFNNQMSRATGQMNINNRDADISMGRSAQDNAQRNAIINAGVQLGSAYATGGASLAARNNNNDESYDY